MDEEEKNTLGRRDFLAWAAAAATALIALPGCVMPPPDSSYAASRPRYRASGDLAYAPPVRNMGPGTADFIIVPDAPVGMAAPVILREETPYAVATAYAPPEPVPTFPAAPVQTFHTVPAVYTPPVAPVQEASPAVAALKLSAMAPAAARGKVRAISRATWAVIPANPGKMKPMGQVKRITIHHEGSAKPNNDASVMEVAKTLRLIHSQHRKRMGAGDIGYHFIIDRTGTIWQGRDWAYQGAHTSGANANNLGVMLLGNFEKQQPTGAQMAALHSLTASLVRMHGLNPATDLFGHSDFGNTQCPGKNLRPHVQMMRQMLR